MSAIINPLNAGWTVVTPIPNSGSAQAESGTTLVGITGATIAATPGQYDFWATGLYAVASTATGSAWGFLAPDTLVIDGLSAMVNVRTQNTDRGALAVNYLGDGNKDIAISSASTSATRFAMQGTFLVTTAGTLQFGFCPETAATLTLNFFRFGYRKVG